MSFLTSESVCGALAAGCTGCKGGIREAWKITGMSFPFLVQSKNLERALGDIFRGNNTQGKQRHTKA